MVKIINILTNWWRNSMFWTDEKIKFLIDNYEAKGKLWCAERLNATEAQIRQKASRLQLKARGKSEAWHNKNKIHSVVLSGRKRPDQATVMKKLHEDGKLIKTPEQKRLLSDLKKEWHRVNGHPKGFLGKNHTQESKDLIGQKSKNYWEDASDEQKLSTKIKSLKTRYANGNINVRKNVTWKGAWREIGGYKKYYRSSWEANYARYLQWLKESNKILDWKHEAEVFWFEGIKRGVVSYLPDFCVTELDGTKEYHEVKGWFDAKSKTKIKRMARYHPKVKLIVIDGKAYAKLKSQMQPLIKDWE